MADNTAEIPILKTVNPTIPLTQDELLAVWQQDEFWGIGGNYSSDPITGKRTPVGV